MGAAGLMSNQPTDSSAARRPLCRLPPPSPLNQTFHWVDFKSGTVTPTQARKKVAIVGGGGGSEHAPLTDPTWEIWGVNAVVRPCCVRNALAEPTAFRADRWFELHDLTERVCRNRRAKGYIKWLAQMPVPLYQFHGRRDAKHSVQYPIDKIVSYFGGLDYFACTFAYELALAIMEGFTTIGLYGVELSSAREALVERPCVEAWLGFALGRGVEVLVGDGYTIGTGRHPYRYAYDQVAERNATFDFCRDHLASNIGYLLSRGEGLA